MMDDINPTPDGSTKATTAIRSTATATPLEWKCSLSNFGRGIKQLGLLLIVAGSVGLITGKISLAILAGLMLALVTLRSLLPVSYRLSNEGIERKTLGYHQFKPWSDFQAAYLNHEMLQLALKNSPFKGQTQWIVRIPLTEKASVIYENLQELMPFPLEAALEEKA